MVVDDHCTHILDCMPHTVGKKRSSSNNFGLSLMVSKRWLRVPRGDRRGPIPISMAILQTEARCVTTDELEPQECWIYQTTADNSAGGCLPVGCGDGVATAICEQALFVGRSSTYILGLHHLSALWPAKRG
jgi:hypothetical protein